jgi:hypothetical protein
MAAVVGRLEVLSGRTPLSLLAVGGQLVTR